MTHRRCLLPDIREESMDGDLEETKLKQKNDVQEYLEAYPIEKFPNWSLTNDAYYVQAPIDKLGEFAFHFRTHLTALILAGNPAIEYLQRRQTTSLNILALFFSKLGLEEFFVVLIVSCLWLFDARLGRLLAALLALGFFISGSLKVLLCLPRPPAPPALRLSEEDKDWAWPSNHALIGTMFPWFIWIYASTNYDLSFAQSLLLLCSVLIWNSGVIWCRVYLGVHSPCDIVAGWMIAVVLLFIFCGFSSRMDEFYLAACTDAPWKVLYFTLAALIGIYIHPRAWPETQSYGEVVCVLSGALIGMYSSRFFVGGGLPHLSLYEQSPESPVHHYILRFILGCVLVAITRLVVKATVKKLVACIYDMCNVNYYSFSSLCKKVPIQPTKRYTSHMRFKPISGKSFSVDRVPHDIDIPVKFVVYSAVGFMVAEGCYLTFNYCGV